MAKDPIMLERITVSPNICHGQPCVRGMRWPVVVILDMLMAGMTSEEVIEEHPELEYEDITASLAYARMASEGSALRFVA